MADFAPFSCKECGLVCANSASLRRHSLCHNRTDGIKCPECSFTSTNKSNLKRHTQKAHSNAYRSYNTPKRAVTTETPKKSGMLAVTGGEKKEDAGVAKMHQENVASQRKGYICKDCGMISATKFKYNRHVACNAGTFAFRCLICNFGGSTKRKIMYHGKKMHPGQKVLPGKAVNAKARFKKKTGIERPGLDGEGKSATAKPRVSDNVRKLRVAKNVRAKQTRRETSETSQTEEETTPAEGPSNIIGPDAEVAGSSGDLPPAVHMAALLAQRAAIQLTLAQIELQIKNLEYLELLKTLSAP